MNENLLSWNLANFITLVMMIAIIWVVLGLVGHTFFRSKSAPATTSITTSGLKLAA